MNLQGRNLSQGLRGEDVRLLHQELQQLGYTITDYELENDVYGSGTIDAVVRFQLRHNMQQTGVVDEETARRINAEVDGELEQTYKVSGHVRLEDGKPLVGVLVHAFDRDMRHEQPLGNTTTDSKGEYQIPYTREQFRRAEKESADLVVKVLDQDGNEITASNIYFNAKSEQTIDITVPSAQNIGQSEYDRYVEELYPLIENVSTSELTDEDLQFLNSETGISAEHLRFFRLDVQWSNQRIERAVFYGLLRQGLSMNYHQLLSEKPRRLHEALKTSIAQNIIPAALGEKFDDIIVRLHELALEAAFEYEDDAESQPLGVLLGTVPEFDEEQQRQIVNFRLRYEGPQEAYFDKLKDETGLDDEKINTLKFTLESNVMVFGHQPMLKKTQELRVERGFSKSRDLVSIKREEWRDITEQLDLPSQFDDSTKYAEAIADQIELTYFTAHVGVRLEDDSELADSDITTFIKNNHSFDLDRTNIDEYINNGAGLSGIEDQQALSGKLKTKQRIARLVHGKNRYDTMRALELQGLTSSLAIEIRGKKSVMETMTPIVEEASSLQIVQNAKVRNMTTQMLGQQFRDIVETRIKVIPRFDFNSVDNREKAIWAGMFGSVNGCECKHCRSIYSPAAYLVDMLQFLKDVPGDVSALNELLERRSDIQHIKLNCTNANISIPYIDLVNEILEEAIAPITAPSVPDRDADEVELQAYEAWLARYQTPEPNDVSQKELKQRLRSEPAHEHSEVYDSVLPDAHYPWELPFDLYHEKTMLFSKHLGLLLDKLQTLMGANRATRATLALSESQWDLIIAPPTTDAGEIDIEVLARQWGFERSSELPVEMRVPDFMMRTGLDYDGVMQLHRALFFSVDGAPQIMLDTSSDPCNIDKHRLRDLTPELLDRVHRFLRLRSHLNWSIDQLDRFMAYLRASTINRNTLLHLADFEKIRRIYRLGIDDALSLFASPPNIELMGRLTRLHSSDLELLIQTVGAFPYSQPMRTLSFLETWADIQPLGLHPQELGYLLFHEDQTPPAFTPLEDGLNQFLDGLRALAEPLQTEAGVPEVGLQNEAIVTNLEQLLAVDSGLVRQLVADNEDNEIVSILRASSDPIKPAIDDLRFWDSTDQEQARHQALQLLVRLQKTVRFITLLGYAPDELAVLETVRSHNDFFDFNNLPTERSETPPSPRERQPVVDSLLLLIRAKEIQHGLRGSEQTLFDYIKYARARGEVVDMGAAGDIDAYFEEVIVNLAESTGWDIVILRELVSCLRLNTARIFTEHRAFLQVETYQQINTFMEYLRRWSLSVDDLFVIGSSRTSSRTLATVLESSARAKYDDKRWYEVLKPMMDVLREKKRDALLAYLIHENTDFQEPSDVYSHYLIDPEMSSCMLTSRIKQANASIQLYVQRILMNLEDMIRPSEDKTEAWHTHWLQWEWMKNYRVWEANRKVFLYPENWIEPELRDDKSPFFKELENELLQDEVNEASVERSYRNYLGKLLETTRLSIRAVYYEEKEKVLHVFARTYSVPHTYFYCKRLSNSSWTAWEKIFANIEGDHLIPVVWNGRLLIFWPAFKEVNGENSKSWEIRLSWGERTHMGWKGNKSAKNRAYIRETARLGKLVDKNQYTFRLDPEDSRLNIYLYEQIIDKSFEGRLRTFSVCKNYFVIDNCTEDVQIGELNTPRVYLHPNRVYADGILLRENDSSGDWAEVLHGKVADDSINDPDQFLNPEELRDLVRGGLGNVILALILAAAGGDNLEHFYARLDEVSSGVRQAELLRRTSAYKPKTFELVLPHQSRQFLSQQPFYFQDQDKTYLVTPSERTGLFLGLFEVTHPVYRFEKFYHPYI